MTHISGEGTWEKGKSSILSFSSLVLIGVVLYRILNSPAFSFAKLNPLLPLMLSLVATVLLSAGSIALKPVREFIESWVKRDLNRGICRIYLFGATGSGKTTLIKNIFTAKLLTKEAATQFFDYYQRKITYDRSIEFGVLIADYTGEKPVMVLTDLPEEFAGPLGDRAINVLLFTVDVVPRILDENGHVLGDEETLSYLQQDADAKIRKRVSKHLDYLTAPMLQVVFGSVYNPQLHSVRLVITKLDLIQEACNRGYLTCPGARDPAQWLRGHFVRVEQDLRRACQENNISDFSVHVVSATQDIGMRTMLSGLWEHHLTATGVQVP